MASGSRSKNATPMTAPALNPKIRCSLSCSLSASSPPSKVLTNAAAAMTRSNTVDSFHAFRPTGYIVPIKLTSWGGSVSYDSYHKRKIGKHVLKPETQMMGYGYDPSLSEGSLKPPIFLTSTFVFKTAQDGKDFFDFTSGRRELGAGQSSGLVYSRFNNPNLEVLEDRLALWEEGETAAVFSSGMSAISTVLWTHVRPGDVVLMSQPLYGGTETLIEKTFPAFGVSAVSFTQGHDRSAVTEAASMASKRAAETGGRVCLIIVETPANPTNSLVDLDLMRETSLQIGKRQKGGRPQIGR